MSGAVKQRGFPSSLPGAMLEQADVVAYLLECGLLTPAAVVDGGVIVRDTSRRNRNFAVERRDGPGYLLKQGLGAEGALSVAHEARVYEDLGVKAAGFAVHLPRYYGYDADRGILALELIGDGEDLRAYHLRTGTFPAALGEQLGRALAGLHRETPAPPAAAPAPWVLSVHRPGLSVFHDTSAAGLQLIKIIQGTAGFAELLDELRQGWSAETFIHQDVKWDNCLAPAEGPGGLRLVDWEIAAAGDPAWDIGSAISQYLSFWLASIPHTGDQPPARFPALAAYPLEAMKAAIRACWNGYADELEVTAGEADTRLLRAVAYAGARLVQTAFEASQYLQQPDSGAVLHLQLAFNVMRRPEAVVTQLLQIPFRGNRP
jgi:aminoglycoside phosphotransferase (APT) family kinase protein